MRATRNAGPEAMFGEAEVRTYDLIQELRGRDYEREARFVVDLVARLKPEGATSLLDLACGTGGHLAALARHYEVEGLDSSPAMLEVARRRAPGARLHRADLAGFDLGRRFDVVVSLFSSIAYAHTRERFEQAVGSIARHLEPGGLALIEPWFAPDEFQADSLHAALVDRPEVKIARVNRSRLERGLSVVEFHYLVVDLLGAHSFSERHEMGLFSRDDYARAFAAAGLTLEHSPESPSGRGLYIGRRGTRP